MPRQQRDDLPGAALKSAEILRLTPSAFRDPRKTAIAAVIRRRAIVPNQWIARALHLGHVSRVSRCWSKEDELAAQLDVTLR